MKIKEMNNAHKFLIGAFILIALAFAYYNLGPNVSAQGFASIKAVPDEISVYFSVEGRGIDANTANEKFAGISAKVLIELEKLGISGGDVQSSGFNIYPEYDYSGGSARIKGYLASEQFTINTKDSNEAVSAVSAALKAGASVSSINFQLSREKENDYKIQALQLASEDARNKAEATALGLGKSLGRLVSVQSQEFYYPGPIALYQKTEGAPAISADQARESISTTPREIEVTANAAVTYKLRLF